MALIDISGTLVLTLVGVQIAGTILAGYRGLGAALILGVGVFVGAVLVELVQPPTGVDDLGVGIGFSIMAFYRPGQLIAAAMLLAIMLWAVRHYRKQSEVE